MGFETRKRGQYFYRSTRDPATGVVRNIYVGRGAKAEAAARELEARRSQRADERAALAQRRAELQPTDALMDALDEGVTLLLEATLLAAGYHRQNYGAWRRRRDGHGRHDRTTPAGIDRPE